MRDTLRGYAAALLDASRSAGRSRQRASDLSAFLDTLEQNDNLRQVLTDPGLPTQTRRSIVEDLLRQRVGPDTVRALSFAVARERPAELLGALEWLAKQATADARRSPDSSPEAEPLASKMVTRERIEGYAIAVFEQEQARTALEEIEDELFRFARIVESSTSLRSTLADPDVALGARLQILVDLLGPRVHPATLALVSYSIRAGRARDLVGALDWLVELTANERDLRIAEVRSAVELDDDQRQRVAESLARVTGRQVELRVVVDPSLVGGLVALVGDTIIDGSMRHRLDQLNRGLKSVALADQFTGDSI